MTERCDMPHCRNESVVRYLDRELCAKHWAQLCDEERERAMLDKLGLERREGEVVRARSAWVFGRNDVTPMT